MTPSDAPTWRTPRRRSAEGVVFRGRRRILQETLSAHIATTFQIARAPPEPRWFLSKLWFESVAGYRAEIFGFSLSDTALEYVRSNGAAMLFDFLTQGEEAIRLSGVNMFSASSAELIAGIESRRALVAGESLAMRKRAYGARLVIDELDFILATGRALGRSWNSVRDMGSSFLRSIPAQVAILNAEREMAVRLEDQARPIAENDLRDMAAFTTVLPLADIVIGEKPFVNLARQAKLGEAYGTRLLTAIGAL